MHTARGGYGSDRTLAATGGAPAPSRRSFSTGMLPRCSSTGFPSLALRLSGRSLFELPTIAELRDLHDAVEIAAGRETVRRSDWVPVRCIDGYEEFEEIRLRERTPNGEALAAINSELRAVIDLAAQTLALRAAAQVFGPIR